MLQSVLPSQMDGEMHVVCSSGRRGQDGMSILQGLLYGRMNQDSSVPLLLLCCVISKHKIKINYH